jgi:uncharacterized damage-inducible protein DinB
MVENYQFLARYNTWFNERLYDACEQLPDAERRRDAGAFFGSIHGTLSHLIWADGTWLQRFTLHGFEFPAPTPATLWQPHATKHSTILFEDWAQMRKGRSALDAAIEAWVRDMTDEELSRNMHYANTKGVQREHPLWKALTHFFNHQTHHRGQVTTLLFQAGVDVGTTDVIALV